MSTMNDKIPIFFGDAVNNTSEITTVINNIFLELKLDKQKNEEVKTDVSKLLNGTSESYIFSKKISSNSSNKSKVDNNSEKTCIKISNINNLENNEEFIDLFAKYGNIKKSNIFANKGYGFITYHEHAHANNAIKEMNKYKYNYSILDITWAK